MYLYLYTHRQIDANNRYAIYQQAFFFSQANMANYEYTYNLSCLTHLVSRFTCNTVVIDATSDPPVSCVKLL